MLAGLELDHIFVCAPEGPRDVGVLMGHDFTWGAGRVHVGQGTANAVFFFDNAYLELIWLNDEREIRSSVVEPLCLWERTRWRETGACPFGIALRPRDRAGDLPLATWDYAAPYLQPGHGMPIVTPPGAAYEPMVFFAAGTAGPPAGYPEDRGVPLEHKEDERRAIRKVYLELPAAEISREVRRAEQSGLFAIRQASEYHMRVEFEGGAAELDFRPGLPLSAVW